jgi:hypothetical protein
VTARSWLVDEQARATEEAMGLVPGVVTPNSCQRLQIQDLNRSIELTFPSRGRL